MEHEVKYYREKIVEMIEQIENQEYLYKIYNYIIVPYNIEKEKKRG